MFLTIKRVKNWGYSQTFNIQLNAVAEWLDLIWAGEAPWDEC